MSFPSPGHLIRLVTVFNSKTMTCSEYSSPPADLRHDAGFEQSPHHRRLYSAPPQLTLLDVLLMQVMQTQAQAPPSSGGFAAMPNLPPLSTIGEAVPSSSDEREALDLDASVAVSGCARNDL
jgi:hypothetical protein